MKSKKKLSIRDIASLSGLSVGTISGVMNGRRIHSPETVAKVKAVVRQSGYSPRKYDGRKTQKSIQQFGFLFPEVAQGKGVITYLGIELARGAEEIFARQNDELIITEMRSGGRTPLCIEKYQVDGLIIRGGDYPEHLETMLQGIPSVWVMGNRPHPVDFDSVSLDNLHLGGLAADRLLKERVEHIFMIHHKDQFNMELGIRLMACEEALKHKSVTCERVLLGDLPTAIAKKKRKSGVFVPGHDAEVLETCRLLQSKGLGPCTKVPIVCAATDRDALLKAYPKLVTLWINPFALGRAAAQQLLWRMMNLNEPSQSILLRPQH